MSRHRAEVTVAAIDSRKEKIGKMSKAGLFNRLADDGPVGDDFESKFISLGVLFVLGEPSIGK
jgi:hypothetical protein